MAKEQGRVKRRERKNITSGVAHVNASFNNTMITITDAMATGQGGGRGPVVMMMVGGGHGGAGTQSLPAPMLYGFQARLFADYLADRSGDAAVFGRLGRAFGAGMSLEAWLADEGAAMGVPGNVEALTADWKAWLTGELGAPAA